MPLCLPQLGEHGSLPSSAAALPRLHIVTVSNEANHPRMLEMVHIAGRYGLHVQVMTFQSNELLMSKLKARAVGREGFHTAGCCELPAASPRLSSSVPPLCRLYCRLCATTASLSLPLAPATTW